MNSSMSMLTMLAKHNQWANELVFAACAKVGPDHLTGSGADYDSVIDILEHLVQVEWSFLDLAHGHTPRRIELDSLHDLRNECAQADSAYLEYASNLDPTAADKERFLVPWFELEITRTEGILQPLTHSHKHRADVSMLLPRLGGAGVEMDLIQWINEQRGKR